MSTNERRDPRRTNSELGRLYWQHHDRVMQRVQPQIMGHISIEVLEGIESFAIDNPGSPVVRMREDMLQTISPRSIAGEPQAVSQFSDLYEKAYGMVYPATRTYLKVYHNVDEISSSHSLNAINLGDLRTFDLEAHENNTLNTFRNELTSKLEKITSIDDVTAFSQVFEIYGEIVSYRYLRERGLKVTRLAKRKGKETPDFKCELSDGKKFFVEVKTPDIVGGDLRNREMMDDALDTQSELEEQRNAGRSIVSATTEFAPYKKYCETDTYDPRSLVGVIDTLQKKFRNAFKEGQFKDGPTFALAVMDRLILPGGKFSLAPYYYDNYADGGISSGVLWHMAYRRPGTLIFRIPEFSGKRSLEDHLGKFGLFVDDERPYPGPGVIILNRGCEPSGRIALGLTNENYSDGDGWLIDDTQCVLHTLCDHWNDGGGSQSCKYSANIEKRHSG